MLPMLWVIENSPLPYGVTSIIIGVTFITVLPLLEPMLDIPDHIRARKKRRR